MGGGTQEKYGRLTVLREVEPKYYRNRKIAMLECRCECGKTVVVRAHDLKTGNTTSCGCSRKQGKLLAAIRKRCCKENTYQYDNEVITVYDAQKHTFKIDKDDFDVINGRYFSVRPSGYVEAFLNGKSIKLHRLITGCPSGMVVDHINGDATDNRRCNLRVCTQMQNIWNTKYVGVNRKNSGWQAAITVNYKKIYLGVFKNKEDAINARIEAEIKYWGDFSRRNIDD